MDKITEMATVEAKDLLPIIYLGGEYDQEKFYCEPKFRSKERENIAKALETHMRKVEDLEEVVKNLQELKQGEIFWMDRASEYKSRIQELEGALRKAIKLMNQMKFDLELMDRGYVSSRVSELEQTLEGGKSCWQEKDCTKPSNNREKANE